MNDEWAPPATFRQIAILDANNFYAACEQAADPALRGKPVGVLSSNDGCIIARSPELRALKIPMAAPLFQVRDLLNRHGVILRSADFAYYRDMSARLMRILIAAFPQVEVYSVDEAFLDLTGMERYLDAQGRLQAVRRHIWEQLHIPVSIGVGPGKVLAKLANHQAKREGSGLAAWPADPAGTEALLRNTPVYKLWGVGGRLARQMAAAGVYTAWDLARLPAQAVRQRWHVPVLRIWHELHGRSMMGLSPVQVPLRSILASRSFAHDIEDLTELEAAMSWFVLCCAQKLMRQQTGARYMAIFLSTNRHKAGPQYRPYREIPLPEPTAYPPELQRYALQALRAMYKPGYGYKKAGIVCWDFSPLAARQASLFEDGPTDKQLRLLQAVHQLNQRKGGRQVQWASFLRYAAYNGWQPRAEHLSTHADTGLAGEDKYLSRVWQALDEGTL
ncbi:MAG: Y-family DNA polymerase [Bacteroidetes bacterium]|nr:Y-family DNA polymerase [Bacteroidota bacterium]